MAFLGALLTAATLYPTYRAPDEPAHVDQVRAVRDGWSVPGLGERQLSRQVVDSYPLVGYRSGVPGEAPPLAAAAAPPRTDRPSFDAIAPDEPTTLGNQMAQHPPLYYLVAGVWLALLELAGPVAFDVTVWWLRLLGVLLIAPLPWLAARTARHLRVDEPAVAGAAVGVLALPMLVHIGSAVNNDVLLVLLASVATVHAAAVSAGDLSVRRAAWLGLAAGAALLTKGFALALLPFLAAAVVVGCTRVRRLRPALLAGAVAGATALAVGGWWWVRNVLVHGTVQPGGAPSPPPPEGFVPDLGWWAPFLVGRLVRRWWIEPDTVARTTPPLLVAATAVAVVLLVVGLVRARDRRRELGVLLVPAAGCLAIVVAGGWRAYARTGIPFAIHGRYLYPGLVGLVAVAGVGAARLLRGWAPAALLAGAVLLQVTAAWWTLTFYWGVEDVTAPLASLRGWLAWSPVPPVVTLAPVVLVVAGVAGAGVAAARLARPRLRP